MRTQFVTSFFLSATLLACGSSDGPSAPMVTELVVPALEAVPFPLLGSGKLGFERIGPFANSYNAVYVINATSSSSAHYFDDKVQFGAALSPDGQRLAYTAYDPATLYDVFVSNLDGTGVQHVTRFPLQEGPPSWSPNGAKVIVPGGSANSFVWDVFSQSPTNNPTDQTQLTHFTVPASGPFTCPVIIDNAVRVTISTSGMLALACLTKEIDVLSPGGAFSASCAPPQADRTKWPNLFAATWSPDGSRVAFIETTSDLNAGFLFTYALKVMNADGTNVTTLASFSIPASANVHAGNGVDPTTSRFVGCRTAHGSFLTFRRLSWLDISG